MDQQSRQIAHVLVDTVSMLQPGGSHSAASLALSRLNELDAVTVEKRVRGDVTELVLGHGFPNAVLALIGVLLAQLATESDLSVDETVLWLRDQIDALAD